MHLEIGLKNYSCGIFKWITEIPFFLMGAILQLCGGLTFLLILGDELKSNREQIDCVYLRIIKN